MNKILKVLKGILVGLGGILPGVSGGMIAASFNIYEDLVNALDEFLKKPIKSVFKIWEYLIGIVVGIGIGFILISTILNMFPIPITLLFVGLIIGGIPNFVKEVKGEPKKTIHYIILVLASLLVLSVLLLPANDIKTISSPLIYFVYIIIGFFIALSLIVPGLSGTMILMAIGVYAFFTDAVADFILNVLNLNISAALELLPAVSIMALAAFLTLIGLSKLISKILVKHRLSFNMAVLGILIVSPINILWTLNLEYKQEGSTIFNHLEPYDYIFGIIALIIGFIIAYKLIIMESKGAEINE